MYFFDQPTKLVIKQTKTTGMAKNCEAVWPDGNWQLAKK